MIPLVPIKLITKKLEWTTFSIKAKSWHCFLKRGYFVFQKAIHFKQMTLVFWIFKSKNFICFTWLYIWQLWPIGVYLWLMCAFYICVFCALHIGVKFSKFQNFPVKSSVSLPAKTVFVSLLSLSYFHWSVSQYKVTAIAFYNICLWRSLTAHVKTTLLSICELFIIKQIS